MRDRRGAVKRLRLVVRFQHSQAEPQWGVAATARVKYEGAGSVVARDTKILEKGDELETDIGGYVFDGSGGNGTFYSGGSGSGGDGEGENIEEEEFGPIVMFDEVLKEAEARGARLPSDMLEAAKSVGIRKVLLLRYLDLQRGVVVNVALVGMLAPYAHIGQPSASKGFFGRLQHADGALPSSVFEAERPRCKFTVKQRIGTYFYKGVMYGSVGFACGIIGQGIANLIMTAKQSIKKSEDDIPVPPLVKSAVLWGVFLAVSSNTRYQIINGLERVVEASPLARRVPPVAMAFTIVVRFANNVYGGMQFVDWARWSGVQ